MTRRILKKLCFALFLFSFLTAAATAKTKERKYGPEFILTGGIIPIYHFSVKPAGMNVKEYHFTGASLQGQFSYRTGKVATRLGLTWNLLFQVADPDNEFLTMLSPRLSIVYHFKKYYYGGMGLSGVIIPGKNKLDGITYPTSFDLWFELIGGIRIPLNSGLAIVAELNYSLKITHGQWSSGKDAAKSPIESETQVANMVVLYGGVLFPINW